MLPNSERLRKSGLFQRVYTARKVVSSDFFSLYVLARHPKSSPKLPLVGFVAGKKVNNKAVKRNYVKRRVSEAYRQLKQSLSSAKSQDDLLLKAELNLEQWYATVWLINEKAIKANWSELKLSIKQCLLLANKKFGNK